MFTIICITLSVKKKKKEYSYFREKESLVTFLVSSCHPIELLHLPPSLLSTPSILGPISVMLLGFPSLTEMSMGPT